MNIETVKQIPDGGYLVNESLSVPIGNRVYPEIEAWIDAGNTPEPAFTDADLLAKAELSAQQESEKLRSEAMLTGLDYSGYQISFTADDGNGMLQVKTAFEMGLANTIIHFANGTKMPIVAADFAAFADWFVVERNKFFVPA